MLGLPVSGGGVPLCVRLKKQRGEDEKKQFANESLPAPDLSFLALSSFFLFEIQVGRRHVASTLRTCQPGPDSPGRLPDHTPDQTASVCDMKVPFQPQAPS